MGRVYGDPVSVRGELIGDGFTCKVHVRYTPYYNETLVQAHNRDDTQHLRGTEGRDHASITFQDDVSAHLTQLMVAMTLGTKLRLRLDQHDPPLLGCELKSTVDYKTWEVNLSRAE
jgi:hypothetical protein